MSVDRPARPRELPCTSSKGPMLGKAKREVRMQTERYPSSPICKKELVCGVLGGEHDLGLQQIELRCARRTGHRGRQGVEKFELFLEEEPADIAVRKPLVHAGR